ncbi:hypothetical protein PtB15_10B426 [Puccinia triticina]|nr:hypothetical protein PtB15_10B426 [Puccinia triticina]
MSSHIHPASAFPQGPGLAAKKPTTPGSKATLSLAKPSKACSTVDMNQLSPHVSKQAPPSPPTSTPTQAPPASPRKRKSVVFNDQPLRSARSIPNHRSRARTIASIPRTTTDAPHLAPVQPTLFSSRAYADQQKRARLSLAAPHPNFLTSPGPSHNREANLRRLESTGSPLGAKAESKKKLSRFYYNPSFLQEVPRRPKSPTLAISAGSKQTARRNSHPMLAEKDQSRLEDSDESSDSDEEVALTLINDTFDLRRTSSCSRLQKLRNEVDDESGDEIAELRPILKKTRGRILLAESVQQATAENGRRRLSLDPAPLLSYRQVIAAVTSKASHKTSPSFPAHASTSALPAANVADSSASNQSADSLQSCSETSNTNLLNGSTVDADLPTDRSDSQGDNLPSEASSSVDSDAIEACLLSSARSCLVTLQASLLPPPDEMRLDPVSPLAKLASPEKHKLSKMGTLDGSPREPRGVLPRAPTCNPRLEPPKPQPRTRGRQRLRARPKSTDSRSTPTTSGPLRTPESSPMRQSQSLPQVTITLREVEDAYISLHDHLDAFFKHWQETGPPSDEDQQSRLGPLFADDVGTALMKCLVREVENLCRHDDTTSAQPQTTSDSNPATPDLRDEISRMIVHSAGKPSSSNDASAPPPAAVNKSGASTNEIRRRVAEIETGQAALRCIAILWSWPSCMVHFDDSHTQRLLALLIQIPKSSVLRRKKNLIAVGLMNNIFKLQRLKRATLEPHVSCVVDAIASTLYLSAGKSGDKGQKVLCLGLSALQQLTTQVPQQMVPKISKFLEPFLASLMAPDSSMLRHHAIAGLGALINCTKQEWDVPAKPPARVQIHELRTSTDALLKLQQGRKEAFREKLSTFVLAFYNDKNTFLRWHLLAKQIKRSLRAGDVGWVISVMATMIALLGKRIRKLDPPLTQVFMPLINHLVRDSRTQHLTSQLWDYYIHVMLQWSIDHRTNNCEEFWALNPTQLTFFLQLFRGTFSVPAKTLPSPKAAPSNPSLGASGISDQYQSLLQPNKDAAGPEPRTNPAVSDTSFQAAALPENGQCQSVDVAHSSSHHILLCAYLYGAIGFIKQYQAHPPMFCSPPSELLALTDTCSRFQYLDIVWDQMIEPFLPTILTGPHDEQRLHVYDVLAALCRYDSSDSPTETNWTPDRLVHPAYHQPPTKPESSTEICLEEFSNAALSSAVVPVEIPALDPLWICSRYDKVLPMIASSISSIQYIKNLNSTQWVKHPSTGSQDSKRVGPRSMFRLWQELMKSIGSVYQACDWIFETELSASLSAIGDTLEHAIQTPAPLALRDEREPHHSPNISIFLFRHLYCILKHGLGPEIMNRRLIVINGSGSPDKPRKISLSFKILSFVFTSSAAGEIANALGPEDWLEYCALAQVIVDDFISAQKVVGFNEKLHDLVNDLSEVLQACTQDRLKSLFGKISMKIVIELMKITEPGVLLDEPSLKPAAAIMIDASFQSLQDGGDVEQDTRKKFIEVFNEFLSRLTQGSLKIMLDSCQIRLSAYLNDERNDDRQLLYHTLLSKLQNVDLALLMPPIELSALVLSPFRNQSSSSTFSSKQFIHFATTSAHAYIGDQENIVQAVKDFTPVSLPSRPVTPVKASDHTRCSPLSVALPNDTKSPSPTSETMCGMQDSSSIRECVPDHPSATTGPRNPLNNESQISPSARENSKDETVRDSSSEPLDKSDAEMIIESPAKLVPLERSDPLSPESPRSSGEDPAGSPAKDNPASAEQIAKTDKASDKVQAVNEQSQTPELRLPEKPTDTTSLPKALNSKPVDAPIDRPDAKSIEKSSATLLSHAKTPQAPSEIRPSIEGYLQQLDPRLSVDPILEAPCLPPPPSETSAACPTHATKPPADSSSQSKHLDVRDPALFGPLLQSQRLSDRAQDGGSPRALQAGFKETSAFHCPSSPPGKQFSGWAIYIAGACGQVDACINPDLSDSKTPLIRLDEMSKPFFQLSINQPGPHAPTGRSAFQLNVKNINSNACLKSSIIPSPCASSSAQPYTPKSFLHPAEAHDRQISPLTTSLGALDTLAPFAKRQGGKNLSFGPPQLASLEPARSAREMLQNMTTRKPQESSKTQVQAGSNPDPSSQTDEGSPDAPEISSKSVLLSKRKRDEPHSNLADKLDHPSQATSTFAAVDLVSRSQPVESGTRADNPAPGRLLSPSSSTRKLMSQTTSTRKSPVRHLLPSISASNEDSSSPPPRKKTKCSESSVAPPIEISDEASNVPKQAISSSSPVARPQADEVQSEVAETSLAPLDSTNSDSPRPSTKRRGRRSDYEILLECASSSQLGRITKTASEILVSRARVTRASSRRLSSDERLSN